MLGVWQGSAGAEKRQREATARSTLFFNRIPHRTPITAQTCIMTKKASPATIRWLQKSTAIVMTRMVIWVGIRVFLYCSSIGISLGSIGGGVSPQNASSPLTDHSRHAYMASFGMAAGETADSTFAAEIAAA